MAKLCSAPAANAGPALTFFHPDYHRRLWPLTRSTGTMRRIMTRVAGLVGVVSAAPYRR